MGILRNMSCEVRQHGGTSNLVLKCSRRLAPDIHEFFKSSNACVAYNF
jgi:hypothetical protein